jgi:hypothetical protein
MKPADDREEADGSSLHSVYIEPLGFALSSSLLVSAKESCIFDHF